MILDLDNVVIKNKHISFNIFDNETYVIYSNDNDMVNEFLLLIAGINDSENGKIYANKKNVFDNEEYFKSRIYLDFRNRYLNTLNFENINDSIISKYNLNADKDIFKKTVFHLGARKEIKVTSKYEFLGQSNTLINYAFLKSLKKENIIINNVFYKIKDEDKVSYIVDDLVDRKLYNTVIVSSDKLECFIDKNVKIIMFSETKAFIINPKEEELLLIYDSINNIDLRNCIMKIGDYTICYNDFNKEELKSLTNKKIKYKKISLYDIFKKMDRISK